MTSASLTSATLEALIALTRKREALQAELAKLEGDIQSALGGPRATGLPERVGKSRKVRGAKKLTKRVPRTKKVAAKAAIPATKSVKPARTGKRGALKDAVLAKLRAAGSKGASVKDLWSKLGVKNQNLHVWFATTGKTISGLKKTGPGVWSYAG